MRSPKVSDIVGIINKNFPFALAEEWDNVGLQLGNPDTIVKRLMVALDPLSEVVENAVSSGCQLLVTHHPMIFKPMRQITSSTVGGSLVLKAASSGLSVISMHTNYDISSGGLNDILAERLGLSETVPLQVSGRFELAKLVVFVPESAMAEVRDVMFSFAESVGNYSSCSFSARGEGTFLPLEGSVPAIGKVGLLEKVKEERLEFLVRRDRIGSAVKALLKAHPYEEPAFDFYPLLNEGEPFGIGRLGKLPIPITLGRYAQTVKTALEADHLRIIGDLSIKVEKVAICSGSGASMLRDAVRAGADLIVTGDMKYHDAREAQASGIAVIDAGHFATERIMVPAVSAFLQASACSSGWELEILQSNDEKEPFCIYT